MRWRSFFATGTKERAALDSLYDTLFSKTNMETLQVKFSVVDTPVIFTHTLKRVPDLFVLTTTTAVGTIYATEEDRSRWTDRQIVVRSNTLLEGRLCVH